MLGLRQYLLLTDFAAAYAYRIKPSLLHWEVGAGEKQGTFRRTV